MLKKAMAMFAAGLLGAAAATQSPSQPADLHGYWDQRCSDCHGHSGEFARRWLTVEQGRLTGHHHRDNLAEFLGNHYLADPLVQPVMQMLAAQAVQAPAFKDRCAGCHGSAAELARRSLEWRDGTLYGRQSGKPVRNYLVVHGGLSAAEIPLMVDTLSRVRSEVAPAR